MIAPRRGEALYVAGGVAVLGLGLWMWALGRGPAASDAGARPRLRVTGAYAVRVSASTEVSAYLTARNTGGGADRLIAVRTDLSPIVMMHRGLENAMVAVDSVPLPARRTVSLTPSGLHVMIMQPRRAVRVGERVRLTLLFSRSDPISVGAPVLAPGDRPPDG
ncbi:copper chaperone PCu(A)C [Actinoallomurus sp. NPDC052308]|uniref:copper chaperone PCu(A)C n=1 Tax=Actinoallomurus sp. NPDC052308 TaxID=3155530 RepID=UPI00342A01DC